jgi:hypothetical protein
MLDTNVEQELQSMHPLVSWRSIAGGLFISFFTMVGLIGLGLAFGGTGIDQETTVKSLGLYTGIWFLISAIISLFCGSYFASRISKISSPRVGSAQGLIIAALFLGGFLFEVVVSIGGAGRLTRDLMTRTSAMMESPTERLSQAPAIKEMIQDVVGNLTLKNDPNFVIASIAAKLIRGDESSAANYLAEEASISTLEAQDRIINLKLKIDDSIQKAKMITGAAMKSIGVSLFLLVFFGGIFSILGGSLGSFTNIRKPIITQKRDYVAREQHA